MTTLISYVKPATELTIPGEKDATTEWSSICEKVKDLIAGNKSLAFSSDNDFISTEKATSIEDNALNLMNGKQQAAYNSWKNGEYSVNAWDFSADPPAGVNVTNLNPKLWTSKVAALERIYKDETSITPAQAKAWVLGNWDMHSLWKALVFVVRSERSACGGKEDKCPKTFIEAVACRKFMRRLNNHEWGLKKANPNAPELALFAEVKALLEKRLKDINGNEN